MDGVGQEQNGPVLLGETCPSHGPAVKPFLTFSRLVEAIMELGPWDSLLSLSYLQRLQEPTLALRVGESNSEGLTVES